MRERSHSRVSFHATGTLFHITANLNDSSGSQLEIVIPASTSNLGPGFDLMGMALSLFLRVRAHAGEPGSGHVLASAGGTAEGWPRTADNLLFRAYETGCAALSIEPRPLVVEVESEIPVARGLGSSAAAIAAGLLLAAQNAPAPVERIRLVELATELEGHPDNASPCLLGGCTLSALTGRGLRVLRPEVHRSLAFAVAWPAHTISTAEARAALPPTVPHAAAVRNASRLALLLEGLRTGDGELLALGSEDEIHVPYRLPLIRGGSEALAAAREAGAHLATISGSGPTLFAIAPTGRADEVARAMAEVFERHAPPAVGRTVELVREPPAVRQERT